MFQLFKKGGRKIGGLLLGIQLFLVFLVPLNIAHAFSVPDCLFWCDPVTGKAIVNVALQDAVSSGAKAVGDAALSVGGPIVMEVLILIASLIFKLSSLFFISMAYILDSAISSTIDGGSVTSPYKISTISIAWTAVRDLSNMFFIFVLLFISIQTILGLAGGSAKRWLSHVIIAAILINFSLFLTGVVIDAGNVLAMGFWDKMKTTQAGKTGSSVSMQLLQGLKLQTIGDVKDASGKPIEQTQDKELYAYLGGIIVTLVAGYVFLAGAVMMIIRTVTLMILMIASPFAFLGFALPKGGGFAQTWLSKLIGNAFVAPAFLAMLYIDSLIINSTDLNKMTGADSTKFGAAFGGDPSSLAIIYHYVLVIILILASLTVANQVSSGAGSTGSAWAKKIIGGGAAAGFAGAGWAGRNTVGRGAAAGLKNEEWVKEQERLIAKGGMRGRLANLQLATLQKAKKGSFDIRNAPMGGAGVVTGLNATGIKTGTGSKKSFATHGGIGASLTGEDIGTENEKALIATAKERFPNNPAAQKAWLEQRGVKLGAKDKEGRNKEVSETLNRGINAAENKKIAEEAVKEHKKQLAEHKVQEDALKAFKQQEAADIAAGRAVSTQLVSQITATTASMKTIEDKMSAEADKIRKSLQNMNADDVAKLMEKDEYRNSKVVQDNLSSKDYTAINKRYMEGGYKGIEWTEAEKKARLDDAAMMGLITRSALANDQIPENTKRMIKNQMKNGTWGHDIDFKKDVAAIVSKGRDAQGNYAAKTSLTPEEKAKLTELQSMMDHEDIASLENSLLLNEHLAKDYTPSTLSAISKKQLEKGGEADAEFVNNLRNTVLRHNTNDRTIEAVVKNTAKKESLFHDEILKNKYTTEYIARLKVLKASQNNGPLNKTETEELNSLNLTTGAKPSNMDEQARTARLRELFAKGNNLTPAEATELKDLS